MKCSGIIIAGGKSVRMGEGKLKQFMVFQEKPLIIHSIANLYPLCEELIISVKNEQQKRKLVPLLKKYYEKAIDSEKIKIVLDRNNEFSGPLNGIISSFSKVTSELAIINPTDTPFVSFQINKLLLEVLITRKADTVTFIDQNGNISTLNVAIKSPKQRLKQLTQIIEEKIKYSLPIRAGDLILTGNRIILLKPSIEKQWILYNVNRIEDFNLASKINNTYESQNQFSAKQFSEIEFQNIPLDKIFSMLKNDENEFFSKTIELFEIWADTHLKNHLKKDFDRFKQKLL